MMYYDDSQKTMELQPQHPQPTTHGRKMEYGAFCARVMKQLKEFGAPSLYNHERLRRPIDTLMTFGSAQP
jgi:hypothetical protein